MYVIISSYFKNFLKIMMYFYITYYLRYVEESLDPSTNCMSLHWH